MESSNQNDRYQPMDVDEQPSIRPAPVAALSDLNARRAMSVPLRASAHTVGFVFSAEMMVHSSAKDHPEQPERIFRIFNVLSDANVLQKMRKIPIRRVKREEALLVHSETHWEKVMSIASMTTQDIVDSEAFYDGLSLYVNPKTPLAAQLSCGGVIEASLAVARNELKKTFAIVRPPGHHAEPDEHMGFCFFNNVAVAVRTVQQMTSVKRVLILDWDVHHGNGTQRAFYDDPSVLYISLHRYEGGQFYPCGPFGSMESCGEGAGLGYSVNIPWPEKGMTDADYIHAFLTIVMPIAMEFAPELVIISAGFDAAEGDDLGECHVSPVGYAHMTHMLSGLAGGRLVVALEGGYNLDSISKSALAVARTIVGEDPPELPPSLASEVGTETIYQVAREQSRYWKSIRPEAVIPREELMPITFSIPELLKAHRQEYLYKHHNMLQVPLMNPEMEERFGTQVMCTSDIMDSQTMVVFVHEFGNIRAELESVATCNLHREHSYLIDCSKELIAWIKGAGYSLLDINVLPKPVTNPEKRRPVVDNVGKIGRDIMTYLWDNYIVLSSALRSVVFVGHGQGCQIVMELLHTRPSSLMRRTVSIIQIVGLSKIPLTPRDANDMRVWYAKHSLVFVPRTHPVFLDGTKKRHGNVWPLDEPNPVKLMIDVMPMIKEHIKKVMAVSPLQNATATHVNYSGAS